MSFCKRATFCCNAVISPIDLAKLAKGILVLIILTIPRPSRPIVCTQFVTGAFDAARPSAVGLLTSRGAFLDGHFLVTKTNDLFLAARTRLHNRLLARPRRRTTRFVARHGLFVDGLGWHRATPLLEYKIKETRCRPLERGCSALYAHPQLVALCVKP
jgi:hypothetical protein